MFDTSRVERQIAAEPPVHLVDLQINVVFTTINGTLAALRYAGELAHQLNAHVRIVVPQIVPYPLPLDCPPVDPRFRIGQIRTRCAHGAIAATRIDIRLCRDIPSCLRESLNPGALVVIGGVKRWWTTRESRLARELKNAGHQVVFADQKDHQKRSLP